MEQTDDVFNINDFTAVTPVEQLAHQLESVINEWNIGGRLPILDFTKASAKNGITFDSVEKRIRIGEEEIIFTYYFPKTELPSLQHALATPFTPNQLLCDLENTNLDLFVGNHITAMFGPIKFCLLRLPSPKIIVTEEDILYLRNAFISAAEAAQCYLPCFILNNKPEKQLYSGIAMGEESFTVFESALLRKAQRQHLHLHGLLFLFKTKIDTPTFRSQSEIRVSVMFEYERQSLPEYGCFHLDDALVPTLNFMSLGTVDSPIERITLLASWPNQSEDVLNEGHNYCDLEETNAFHWQFVMNFEPKEGCMAATLRRLLDVGLEKDSNLLASEYRSSRSKAYSPSITNPTGVDYDPENIFPMNPEKQEIWLNAVMAGEKDEPKPLNSLVKQLFARSKSFEPGSLLDRLAVAFFSLSIDDLHWRHSGNQLFVAFVDKLRADYSKMKSNPDLQVPNYSKCRLHQLLEMLQLCANNRNMFFDLLDNSVSNGMDVFYDASEDMDNHLGKQASKGDEESADGKGRRDHHQNMFLLKSPNVPLYDFHTQNPKPHTELEMKNLEETCEESEQEQFNKYLAPLKSDMQAFKAANPLGCFEDFVRWHSPKDFDEEMKTLSTRFEQPGNDWIKLWEGVSAIPVVSQVKLFNDASVMEEIFDVLESATILDVAQLLLPVIYTRAGVELIKRFQEIEQSSELAVVQQKINLMIDALDRATNSGDRDDYLEALKWITYLEKTFMVYKSSFDEISIWVAEALSDGPVPKADEIEKLCCYLTEAWAKDYSSNEESTLFPSGYNVAGGASSPLGTVLHKLMCNKNTDAQNFEVFPKPTNRFYTIHWVTVAPAEGSRPVPHRMTAVLKEDEFRICGSFTNDYKKA